MPDADGDESDSSHFWNVADVEKEMDDEGDSDSDGETEDVSFSLNEPALTPQHKQAQHEAWLPFAHFLGQLPGLKDFVYTCAHHVPACVLAALHQHHPRSRLHVRAFTLRSLFPERNQPCDIDPDELALATSPCLYSVHAAGGAASFNLEALNHMVMGSAPGLRRLQIRLNTRGGSLALLESTPTPHQPWTGFHTGPGAADSAQQPPAQPAKGRLESLVLIGPFETHGIDAWNNRTDLTMLRRLELRIDSIATLNALTALAADNGLRSLEALALSILSSNHFENTPAALDHPASLLLHALPPLRSLHLTGYFAAATVHAILHRHGPALRKLFLLPARILGASTALITPWAFRNDDDSANNPNPNPNDPNNPSNPIPPPKPLPEHTPLIHALAAHCPHLITLTLRTHRYHGQRPEVAAYRALSALRNLRRATLHLDCRLPASMREALQGDRAGLVRQTWLNCAVDGELARAIFKVVAGGRGEGGLEWLRLRTEVPWEIVRRFRSDYNTIAEWVGRSWVCAREGGAAGEEGVQVREVGGGDAASRMDAWEAMEDMEDECVLLWNRLWPTRGVCSTLR